MEKEKWWTWKGDGRKELNVMDMQSRSLSHCIWYIWILNRISNKTKKFDQENLGNQFTWVRPVAQEAMYQRVPLG